MPERDHHASNMNIFNPAKVHLKTLQSWNISNQITFNKYRASVRRLLRRSAPLWHHQRFFRQVYFSGQREKLCRGFPLRKFSPVIFICNNFLLLSLLLLSLFYLFTTTKDVSLQVESESEFEANLPNILTFT